MATIQVLPTDTFDAWRVKTNSISTALGDTSTLTTTATDAASALNEVDSKIGDLAGLTVSAADLVSAVNEARRMAFVAALALG